jgi:hypothetical protein
VPLPAPGGDSLPLGFSPTERIGAAAGACGRTPRCNAGVGLFDDNDDLSSSETALSAGIPLGLRLATVVLLHHGLDSCSDSSHQVWSVLVFASCLAWFPYAEKVSLRRFLVCLACCAGDFFPEMRDREIHSGTPTAERRQRIRLNIKSSCASSTTWR